jgi:hypothetical protein
MWKYAVGVLVVIVVAVIGLMAYQGMFIPLKVVEIKTGPYTMLYINYVGDYSTCGKAFEQVYALAGKEGINCSKGIGIYLDDPKTVAKGQARSQIGVILEGKDLQKVAALKKKKLLVQSIPARQSLTVEFPIKNSLSYMVGAIRAYPVLGKALAEKNLKPICCLEVYDMAAMQAWYIFQLDKSPAAKTPAKKMPCK